MQEEIRPVEFVIHVLLDYVASKKLELKIQLNMLQGQTISKIISLYLFITILVSCSTTSLYTYKSQSQLVNTSYGFMYSVKDKKNAITYFFNFDYTTEDDYLKLHLIIENQSNEDIIFHSDSVYLSSNTIKKYPIQKKIIIKNMNKSLKERIEDPSYQSDLKLIDELSSSLPSSENTQKIESKIKEKELEIEEIFAEIEQIKNELQDIEVNMAPREFKIMKKSKFYSYLLFNLDATFLESDEVNLRLSDSFDQVILSKLLQ